MVGVVAPGTILAARWVFGPTSVGGNGPPRAGYAVHSGACPRGLVLRHVLLLVRKYTSSTESATSRMIAIGQFLL